MPGKSPINVQRKWQKEVSWKTTWIIYWEAGRKVSSTVCVLSRSVVSDSLWPDDCCRPVSFVHGILQARILVWVAMHSSRGSSQPRDWTQISCIAGRFFTIWATREPKELEWVAYLFSRGSYQPRNQTRVSYIAGGFFTSWTTREAPEGWLGQSI